MTRLAILTAAFIAVACASATPQVPATPASGDIPIEGVAATVNDEPISYSDVRERARLLLLGLQTEPDEATQQRVLQQALEQLIEERLQLQKAAEFELEVEQDAVRSRLSDMAQSSGLDVDGLYRELLGAGINPRSLEEQMRADIAWRRLMSGLYGRNIRISDNQIDDLLNQLKSDVNRTRYQLSEIFLFAPVSDTERRQQARDLAFTLVEQFNQGAAFPALAQRFSASATAATGGDMGWVTLAELDPEAGTAIEALPGPGFTPPVETAEGIYLYAVRNKQEPQELTRLVEIKQLIARDGSRAALDAALEADANCETVEEYAETRENFTAIDLGAVNPDELNAENRDRVSATAVGNASEAFETRAGLAVTFVCGQQTGGAQIPSRDQIENQLYTQQLAMISDRELRDLKREAFIVRR